jgi:predicted amidohydrolase YtcJ
MTGRTLSVLLLGGFFLAGVSAASPLPPAAADLILLGGKIWTVNKAQPEAEALAVWHDRILAVGTTDEIRKLTGPATREVLLHGRRVLPGFYDSHIHFLGGGLQLGQVDLKDAKDEAEFGRRLREFDRKLPRDRWLLGGDWDHDRTFNGILPTAELLDRYVPDRPVFIRRYDGHMGVVNSKVLRMAEITAEKADPPGGVIYRKPGGKEPTGLLRDNAMSLVERLIPPPSDEQMAEAVRAALAEARAAGLTSIQDMDGSDPATRRRLFRLYQQLARSGQLTLRVDLRWPLAEWEQLAGLGTEAAFGSDWVRIGGLKGFIDGSLGSSTAKMFEPYVHEPNSTGVYVTPLDALRKYIAAADRVGLSVAVHAIGDRGNAEMLDIFAATAKQNGARDRRFRIEHAQHLRPEDFGRFRDLDVIASMQPYHLIDDGRWAEGRIGAKRCASSYANASLLSAGAKLAFGSDWPVAPLNPLLGIDAAVNRRTLDGKHPEGWFPEQKIGVRDAVAAYTLTAAYAALQEKDRGSLEPGKLADLVVLSRDILDEKERDHIAATQVLLTMVGGKEVFTREAESPKRDVSPKRQRGEVDRDAPAWPPTKGPLATRWAKDVSPDKVHPEYPRPQMVRKDWLNLNGLWEFADAKKDEEPPVGKKLDGQILVPFPVESALSGVMKPAERVWYRRTFDVKKEWAGQRLLLHFGAVNWEATIWVNGKKFDTHRGGYDGFTLDVTDALKKDGPQEIVVGVWNPIDTGTQPRGKQVKKPGGIFYTASTGIWQTVWLEPVNKGWIESLQIIPDVDKGAVKVSVKTAGEPLGNTFYSVEVLDGTKVVAKESGLDNTQTLKIPEPKLWSPESPHLYGLRVGIHGMLRENGGDQVESYFGLRKIALGKDDKGVTRLLLNGKPYFQVGPLDQGFWPDGLYTAPTDEALKFDIEMTKKLGFNMTRKHVKVEPERWYYWCDKLGLLVWQDMPSGDRSIGGADPDIKRSPESAKQYETELTRLIEGRGNHPSIILWVVFNEGWGQFDTERITKLAQDLDPSRLVDCASGWADRKVGSVRDVHIYPGPGSPPPEAERAAVLGEFGGLGLKVDGHTWENKTWGYQGTKDSADLTRRYEKLLQRVWQLKDDPGLSAAVYTQITDVETEGNGLLTYDREVVKVDLARTAAVNRGDFTHLPQVKVVVPTSQEKGIEWRYFTWKPQGEKPGAEWFKPDYDDSKWRKGPGGFGTKGTPGSVIGTDWHTADIWLRREFTLPEEKLANPYLLLHHDEDAEIYLNGVLAAKVAGFVTEYQEVPISDEARKTLRPGKNTIAVHCHQTTGGQYIDVGVVDVKETKP